MSFLFDAWRPMPAKPDAETSSDRLFAAWAFNSDNVYSRKQNRWTGCCTPRESHMHGSAWSDEETADPLYADDRNFYKVELWTKDRLHVLRLLYAGNNLDGQRMNSRSTLGSVRGRG